VILLNLLSQYLNKANNVWLSYAGSDGIVLSIGSSTPIVNAFAINYFKDFVTKDLKVNAPIFEKIRESFLIGHEMML
jgi:hypothetical protein